MNYFKAAEQVLSSVPALERALENLQHTAARAVFNSNSTTDFAYCRTAHRGAYAFNNGNP